MAIRPPPVGEVLQQLNNMMEQSGVRGELDKTVNALVQSALSRLDLLTREEFDAQVETLQRARAQVAQMEAQLAELEKTLNEKA